MKGVGEGQSGPIVSGAVADAFARRREAGLALVECADAMTRTGAAMAVSHMITSETMQIDPALGCL